MRFYLIINLLLLVSVSFGNNNTINVGIYNTNEPIAITVGVYVGEYEILGDNQLIGTINNDGNAQVANEGGKISVKINKKKLGSYTIVQFNRKSWGNIFRIKPTTPSLAEHQFHDNLIIKAKGSRLRLINSVYIEHYIAGVIESEAGSRQNLEYYKVQAIICRTYALANKRRHSSEGFSVCDKVHCQVYHNRSKSNPDIQKAAYETKGIVIVDSDINLITAGFHSNCGGQTVNSEDAWKYPVSYLKSVCDTFCTDMPHAFWEHRMPKPNWLDYLSKNYQFPISDSMYIECAIEHFPECRERYFSYVDSTITTPKIRNDLKLRSAFFYLEEVNDTVIFKGNGFGHGIGLCQEGAMKMSESGYTFDQILHFYYTSVHLIDLKNLDFFKD